MKSFKGRVSGVWPIAEAAGFLPVRAVAFALSACVAVGSNAALGQASTVVADVNQGTETGLEEIVVTAQHKEESLQHAALAVNVISADDITGRAVNMAEDLSRVVPELEISTGGGGTSQVSLRGVGALTGNAFAEQVVPFNFNGVYLARSGESNGMFFDLQRIEVLEGPQGTLYGRNANAGTVNLIAAEPQYDFSSSASARTGNYGLFEGEAVLNMPLSSNIALRIAGQTIEHDGYFSDGYGDQRQQSGRVSALFAGDGGLKIVITGDYTHVGDKGPAQVLGDPFLEPSNPWLGPSSPQAENYWKSTPPTSFLESPPEADGYNRSYLSGVMATINWETGAGTLTFIPAYRHSVFNYDTPTPGFRLINFEGSSDTSLEARYATPENYRLHGIGGLYYLNDTGTFSNWTYISDLAGGPTPTTAAYHTRATAAFAQGTFDITSAVRLVGGLRYSEERKSDSGTIQVPPNSTAPFSGSLDYNKVTYRAGLEADLSAQSLAYLTFATGFKAGGFYPAAPPNTFKPEFMNAWSLGSKNRFLQNRLQLNLEAFYWDYKNKQVNELGPINPGGYTLITQNAGNATLYGTEVQSSYLLTPADTISVTALYERAWYDNFLASWSPTEPTTGCPVTVENPITFQVNCSGNDLALAPHWSGSFNYAHVFSLPNAADVKFSLSGIAKSSYWLGDDHVAGEVQPGYLIGDTALDYKAPHDKWTVGVFVNNVADHAVSNFAFIQPLLGRPMLALGAPRTFGLRAHVNF